MNKVQRIVHHFATPTKTEQGYQVFGKTILIEAVSSSCRIIVHKDYSLLTKEDSDEFAAFAVKENDIVMSGCIVRIHPYRLMCPTASGKIAYLFEVPAPIRGHRQTYPNVYQFVPALISIPARIPAERLLLPENFLMYALPQDRLLDQSKLLPRLHARAARQVKDTLCSV